MVAGKLRAFVESRRMRLEFDPVPSPAQTALLVAATEAPRTFSPSLIPRTSADQGLVTGLSVLTSYLATAWVQDASRSLARSIAGAANMSDAPASSGGQRWAAVGVDAALIPAGLLVRAVVPGGPLTPAWMAATRELGNVAIRTGIAGASLTAAQAVWAALDAVVGPLPQGRRLADLPIAVPLGFATSLFSELRRRGQVNAGEDESFIGPLQPPQVLRSVGSALAATSGLAALVVGESALSGALVRVLDSRLPGGNRLWGRVVRGAGASAVAVAVAALWDASVRRVEAGSRTVDPIIEQMVPQHELPLLASGGPRSAVKWETLTKESRRHIASSVATRGSARGMPAELSIEEVTGEPARCEPVQVYVGVESAPTARERVDLALAEMERLGAFERSLLVLVSPTGTGYVNHVALSAMQYLAQGDVATVAMQYSKRPSSMALFQRHDALAQNRLLWLEIAARLRRASQRPRVVVFGESLGAQTSQEVFQGWGTLGPVALGIERALWVGTPAVSAWLREVQLEDRLDVQPGAIGVFNDFAQYRELSNAQRDAMRFILLSHDNDGVVRFNPRIAVERPAWLPDRRTSTVVTTPPGASPRGLPAGMRWLPGTSFYQLLVDMTRSHSHLGYVAYGHDYRPDLVRFVDAAYQFGASEERLTRIEAAVRQRERIRYALMNE